MREGHMAELLAEIASLREQMKTALKRIDTLEDSVKTLPRIATLLEVTIETNKKQSDTLDNINANLTKLNNSYDNLTGRIGTIEDDVKTSKNNSSINLNKLATETVFKIVPSILGGLVLAWFLIQFGMK
jgi:chromosome segregation ATPase